MYSDLDNFEIRESFESFITWNLFGISSIPLPNTLLHVSTIERWLSHSPYPVKILIAGITLRHVLCLAENQKVYFGWEPAHWKDEAGNRCRHIVLCHLSWVGFLFLCFIHHMRESEFMDRLSRPQALIVKLLIKGLPEIFDCIDD